MIFPLWSASRKSAAEPAPSTPPGARIYAVGDIHGRLDLLETLAQKVENDLRHSAPPGEAVTVFLGDYIDRGRDSAGVVERLAKGDFPTPIVSLRGNHEATLLDFLENESVLEDWRRYGGLETLVSYRVDVREAMRGLNFGAARDAFRAALPAGHLAFLAETKLFWSAGGYFFCHAGVRPHVALEQQSERDLLWIRDEFNAYRGDFEKIIVHGHTPVPQAQVLPNRINIDTGAYATGVLTCLVLEGAERRFIST